MNAQYAPVATNRVDLDPTVKDIWGCRWRASPTRIIRRHAAQLQTVPALLAILERWRGLLAGVVRFASTTRSPILPGGSQMRGPAARFPPDRRHRNHQHGSMRMASTERKAWSTNSGDSRIRILHRRRLGAADVRAITDADGASDGMAHGAGIVD